MRLSTPFLLLLVLIVSGCGYVPATSESGDQALQRPEKSTSSTIDQDKASQIAMSVFYKTSSFGAFDYRWSLDEANNELVLETPELMSVEELENFFQFTFSNPSTIGTIYVYKQYETAPLFGYSPVQEPGSTYAYLHGNYFLRDAPDGSCSSTVLSIYDCDYTINYYIAQYTGESVPVAPEKKDLMDIYALNGENLLYETGFSREEDVSPKTDAVLIFSLTYQAHKLSPTKLTYALEVDPTLNAETARPRQASYEDSYHKVELLGVEGSTAELLIDGTSYFLDAGSSVSLDVDGGSVPTRREYYVYEAVDLS